jgi:putative phosphoesterase
VLSEPGVCARPIVVGVLSDTHGHLYPQVREMLRGVDHILHAGDVGSPQVLAGLKTIAPVTAVRGNCDVETWAQSLPLRAELELGGVRVLMGHMAGRLREELERRARDERRDDDGRQGDGAGFRVVVSGHSHRVETEERDGVLHLNPGSAGPERFGHPRTLARLVIGPAPEGDHFVWAGAPVQIKAEILVVPIGSGPRDL